MTIPPEILALILAQARELDKVNPRHRKELVEIAVQVFKRLEAQMKKLAPGKYATTQVATVMARVQALLVVAAEKYGAEVAKVVEQIHTAGAKRGREALVEQITAWQDAGVLSESDAATVGTDVADELLDKGLLEAKKASQKAYGEEAIAKMRKALVRGALAGETIAQTTEQIAKELEIPKWRAERIVRTEHSLAYHRRQILDLIDRYGDEAETMWGKQLLAVHDDRTGRDSIYVDLQMRRLLEAFEDNIGHVYQHPPNRPNDRESMIFVPMKALERFEELADDPDVGIIRRTRREAQVALGMENQGRLNNPRRSPDPAADFIDIDAEGNERKWDVKKFFSYAPPEQGGYELQDTLNKIQAELNKGENVILDTVDLKAEHLQEIKDNLSRLNLRGLVVTFYP